MGLSSVLQPILDRVRTDVSATKSDGAVVLNKTQPITPERIEAHLNGGPARGVYLIDQGEDTTRVAVLDIDNHGADLDWPAMFTLTEPIIAACELEGLHPRAWVSGGGKGIHLIFLWDKPQDAYSVRQKFKDILESVGLKAGADKGGIVGGFVEIFPKQDKVEVGRYGNQFFLPLANKSTPMDIDILGRLHLKDKEFALTQDWPMSDAVMQYIKPPPPVREEAEGQTPAYWRDVLSYISPDVGYDKWIHVGMGLHHEFNGGPHGLTLWDEWSSAGSDYPGWEKLRDKYRTFGDKHSRVTGGTLRSYASGDGWTAPIEHIFDQLATESAGEEGGGDDCPEDQSLTVPLPLNWPQIAQKMLRTNFKVKGELSLRYIQDGWYVFEDTSYRQLGRKEVEASCRNFLDTLYKIPPPSKTSPVSAPVEFCPTRNHVGELAEALITKTQKVGVEAPCWLDDTEAQANCYMALEDGLLHVPTKELEEHTPMFFNLSSLPYSWADTKDAKCPMWIKFLEDQWGDDPESLECFQEMFGYLLTPDTSQQKIFCIKGEKRTGKGTMCRIIEHIMGRNNIITTKFSNLAGPFGLQPVLGKTVCLLSEARNVGGRFVNISGAVEDMLMISGEDSVTVDRKNTTSWTGHLPVRFLITCNDLPMLGDRSEAFASRFIFLETTKSFFNKEDHGLEARLKTESAGILRWAIEGRDRLMERGYFRQPNAAKHLATEMRSTGNPMRAFLDECCILDSEARTDKSDIYYAYIGWIEREGLRSRETKTMFFKNLMRVLKDKIHEEGLEEGVEPCILGLAVR